MAWRMSNLSGSWVRSKGRNQEGSEVDLQHTRSWYRLLWLEASKMSDMNEWHLDKKVPISIIFVMLIQTFGVIWWSAKIDSRVENVEKMTALASTQDSRIVRLETKMDTIFVTLEEIKNILRGK